MFLQGHYAPVKEEISSECEVVGVLPEAVSGEFARVGPNPRFTPKGGYHWFDGDGMVSGTQFDASRRGKKGLKSSLDKNEGTHRSGEGGGEPA